MNPNSNILSNIKNILNKKDDNYKYDSIIDNKISLLKKKNQNFQISNFNSKRKIPNKEELKKVYNKFIKKVNNIKVEKDNYRLYNYDLNINNLYLKNDNQFILVKLNIKDNKKYILYLSFFLKEKSDIKFVFNNYKNTLIYGVKYDINEKIIFNTNNLITYNDYLEFYIIFSPKNIIHIENLHLSLREISNKTNNITLLKNNNKVTIF